MQRIIRENTTSTSEHTRIIKALANGSDFLAISSGE
jgi:hypothetical protein